MHETDQNSNSNVVLKDHAAEKHNWKHMVHCHLPVVISSLPYGPVLNQVAKTVAHRDKWVVEQTFNLGSERRILETISDITVAAKIPG